MKSLCKNNVSPDVTQGNAIADTYFLRERNRALHDSDGLQLESFSDAKLIELIKDARFLARPEVIAVMQKQASAPVVSAYWNVRFPGQIDSTLVIADKLKFIFICESQMPQPGGNGSRRLIPSNR